MTRPTGNKVFAKPRADGQPIEAGFVSMAKASIRPAESWEQASELDNMRLIYFCGAMHAWTAVIEWMVPNSDRLKPGGKKVFDQIEAEIREYGDMQ